LGAGAIQYELLPIVGGAATVAILIARRRDALPSFLLAISIVVLGALGATWLWLGVPLSGKLAFFAGRSLGTPDDGVRAARVSTFGPLRFVPFIYVAGALLMKWYVCIPVLAWIGSRSRRLTRPEVSLPLSVTIG